MQEVSAEEFLCWEEKQIQKGGDKESLFLLLELWISLKIVIHLQQLILVFEPF